MESFSSLNRKFSIKCYSKSFQKNIIDKFPPNKENLIDTLHIGFKNIPDEIINYKKTLYTVILGYELSNDKIINYLISNKDNLQVYTTCSINQNYLKNKYKINSKIITFDIHRSSADKTKKLIYFYKISDNENLENNKEFVNYFNNNSSYNDIKSIKIIFLEPLTFINDPYVSICITNHIQSEFINLYFLNFSDIINNFKKEYPNIIHKYYEYKNNFIKIHNFLYIISQSKKFIYNNVVDTQLHQRIDNMYKFKETDPNHFIIFSDNFDYLKSISNNTILKIYITSNDQYIIRKLENNFIVINKYFLDEKMHQIIKKYHSEKNADIENKYFLYKPAKLYQFILANDNDIDLTKNYINLFNKYNITVPIQIYSNIKAKFNYDKIKYLTLQEFVPAENTKIYFSQFFDFDKFFNQIILKDNIEIKFIDKINILVSSTQYPSYGGAATNTYNIIKYLQKNNKYKTAGIFMDSINEIYQKANPDNLPNVIGLTYKDFNSPNIQANIVTQLFNPDIAFCKNLLAPKFIYDVFPNCINIFLVSGIWGFSQIECGANEITDFKPIRRQQEEIAINVANIIICNSNLTIDYFQKIYPDILQNKLQLKPLDTTKYNVHHIQTIPNEKKTIDIIIIASNVNRPVKNIKFFKDIITFDKKFKHKKITIIGENSDSLFQDLTENYNLDIIPLIKQNEVESYLVKSKIIIIPSLFDSNSNVFREAVFSNVIPFISNNVAHPQKFPKFLVLDSYDIVEWCFKILYTLDNYLEIASRYNLPATFNNNDDLLDYVQ